MTGPSYLTHSRETFQTRTSELLNIYQNCVLCPRECKVDRRKKPEGFCKSGARAGVASSNLHFGEEPFISGTRGSGTVFFHHCTMSCLFCQNFPFSQIHSFPELPDEKLAELLIELQGKGAHNINIVNPTHFVPSMAEAVRIASQDGLHIPLVYNSGGYEKVETISLLENIVDIWLPDVKYASDDLARKYSNAEDYVSMNRKSVKKMFDLSGPLVLDDNGMAVRGLAIRHLVLPGEIDNSKKCLDWISRELGSETVVSIMSQYFPAWKAVETPGLDRKLKKTEYDEVCDYALQIGISNALIQEIDE
jgi:putative pyruvate formate lyase activating enzyme